MKPPCAWSSAALSLWTALTPSASINLRVSQLHGFGQTSLANVSSNSVNFDSYDSEPLASARHPESHFHALLARLTASFHGRIDSGPDDWTKNFSSYREHLVMPVVASICAALTHKPSLAKYRRSGHHADDEARASKGFSAAPMLLLVAMLTQVPQAGPQWVAAQVPFLFMILGYGIGRTGPPKVKALGAALLAAYAMCMLTTAGLSSNKDVADILGKLVPVEALSSKILGGTALVGACLGAAAACLLLAPGLATLCRGAGLGGLFFLWVLVLLGAWVDLNVVAATKMVEVISASVPARLQIPSFAAGLIVSSWTTKPGAAWCFIAAAAAVSYVFSSRLQLGDATWHLICRGGLLPLQALMLWFFMDFAALRPKALQHALPGLPVGELFDFMPITFGVLFVPALLSEHGVFQDILKNKPIALLTLCSLCFLIESAIWTWFREAQNDGRLLGREEPEAEVLQVHPGETFLGSFKGEQNGIRGSLPFRLLQGLSYYALLSMVPMYAIPPIRTMYQAWNSPEHVRLPEQVGELHGWRAVVYSTAVSEGIMVWSWLVIGMAGAVVVWVSIGQLMFAPAWRFRTMPAKDLQKNPDDDLVLAFRYCTRGTNPGIVADNCKKVYAVLQASGLNKETWKLEVVTDNPLQLYKLRPEGIDVLETLCPDSYKCPNGGKFKARAMHYAILHSESNLRPTDWICHLDEETYFDIHTVCAVYRHCKEQNAIVASGAKVYPDMGQGTIMYNTFGIQPETLSTALCDSCRVGDDLGKFRLCYEGIGYAAIGMHGSFAVINQKVEETVGFDFGAEGSICEDSYFAMKAKGQINLGMSWINAFMYEQSPFTAMDLMRQRGRWFHGLFFCTALGGHGFSFKDTCMLCFMIMTWSCCFAVFGLNVAFNVHSLLSGVADSNLLLTCSMVSFCFRMNYVVGFVHSFSPYLEGWQYWLTLFYMQNTIMPIMIGMMEMGGVAHGMWLLFMRESVFHIVQKEKKQLVATNFKGKDTSERLKA